MRTATIERKTGETQISLTLNLDGTGKCEVENPIGFFDHMLRSFCKHGLFDLTELDFEFDFGEGRVTDFLIFLEKFRGI